MSSIGIIHLIGSVLQHVPPREPRNFKKLQETSRNFKCIVPNTGIIQKSCRGERLGIVPKAGIIQKTSSRLRPRDRERSQYVRLELSQTGASKLSMAETSPEGKKEASNSEGSTQTATVKEVWSAHSLNGDRISNLGRIHCHLCAKTMVGQGAFDDHLNGKVHKRSLHNARADAAHAVTP